MIRQTRILLLLITIAIMGACSEEVKPPAAPQFELTDHPSIDFSMVRPKGWDIKPIDQPALGWSLNSPSGVTGHVILGEANPVFFLDATLATQTAMTDLMRDDIRLITLRLRSVNALFQSELSLVTTKTYHGRSADGMPVISRVLTLGLPSLGRGQTTDYLNIFTRAVEDEPISLEGLSANGGFTRFTILYSLTPVVDARGRSISVGSSPGMARTILIVESDNDEGATNLVTDAIQHFSSGYFAAKPVRISKENANFTITEIERLLGLVVGIDASKSVQFTEHEEFVNGILPTIDLMDELGYRTRVAVARSCDGLLSRPVATAAAFTEGLEDARAHLSDRAQSIINEEKCRDGGNQLLLGLDRQLAIPDPDLEPVDVKVFVGITDGDDRSHPIDCQDCIQIIDPVAMGVRTASSEWNATVIAPKNKCNRGDVSAIAVGSSLQDFSRQDRIGFVDLCSKDWSANLVDHLRGQLAQESPYILPRSPIFETLAVSLNDTQLNADLQKGYIFELDSGSIQLGSLVVGRPGDAIETTASYLVH